ncbi:MAG: tRNA pseudouridine(55) synthase TruB [Acidimicrobiales bacterium]
MSGTMTPDDRNGGLELFELAAPAKAANPARPGRSLHVLDDPGGFVVVDKQMGWTSHDVVARCRRLLGTRKVGHAGTLDPDATGVLIVGVGRATRLLRFASALPKTYVGEVVLGVTTSTLDASGDVTGKFDMSSVGLEDVREAARSLTGRIQQVPPMVSAVQIGGRRLHELAREGLEVERAARGVEVFRFEAFETGQSGCFRVLVECSSGTYVRVLAADLGARLGGGAHLRRLRRLAVGSFRDVEALALEDVAPGRVRPPEEFVRDLPGGVADDDLSQALGHGRTVERLAVGVVGDGPWAVLDRSGRLVAVCEAVGLERVKPVVVVRTSDSSRAGVGSAAGDE